MYLLIIHLIVLIFIRTIFLNHYFDRLGNFFDHIVKVPLAS